MFAVHETHRLIPTKYSEGGSVLDNLGLPDEVLADLSELDAATNDRVIAGNNGALLDIGPGELLSGVPEADIVNAAFCHPGPHGARFNSPRRGAWYAGLDLETSKEEVAFHKVRFLVNARLYEVETCQYRDFLADFSGEYHILNEVTEAACLQADPTPDCYGAGQALAHQLLHAQVPGIAYPSVRHSGGTCVVCFRPALVNNPRRDLVHEFLVHVPSTGSTTTTWSVARQP